MVCENCSCGIASTEKQYCEDCFDNWRVYDDKDYESSDYLSDLFADALQALRSNRIDAFFDEMERALPLPFSGMSDVIYKWAGKTR